MSKILKFPDYDRIEEEACDWIARLDARPLTSAEEQTLRTWLQADVRHQQVLFEVAALMDQMSIVSTLNRLLPLSEVSMAPDARASRPKKRIAAFAVAAAVVVGIALIGPVNSLRQPDYETAIGEIRGVMMEDGSRVTINTDSSVSVRFRETERRLVLDRGEAMFQVTHDEQRPFVVETNGYDIRAVGTAFNVSKTGTEVEIIVTEGVVEVSRSKQSRFSIRGTGQPAQRSPEIRRLGAGDQMKITATDIETQSIDPSQVDATLSWRQGELVFRGESLEFVVAEVSRYSPVTITFGDDDIREIPVGGVFATGDIDNLVDLLEHGFGIRAERTPDGSSINLTRPEPPQR